MWREQEKFLSPAMLLMWVYGRCTYLHAFPFMQATAMMKFHCWVLLYISSQAQ